MIIDGLFTLSFGIHQYPKSFFLKAKVCDENGDNEHEVTLPYFGMYAGEEFDSFDDLNPPVSRGLNSMILKDDIHSKLPPTENIENNDEMLKEVKFFIKKEEEHEVRILRKREKVIRNIRNGFQNSKWVKVCVFIF
jgi:uncharacterized protein YkuJ